MNDMIKGQSEKKQWQWQPLLAIICYYDCGSLTHTTNAEAFSSQRLSITYKVNLLCVFSFSLYPLNFDAIGT